MLRFEDPTFLWLLWLIPVLILVRLVDGDFIKIPVGRMATISSTGCTTPRDFSRQA